MQTKQYILVAHRYTPMYKLVEAVVDIAGFKFEVVGAANPSEALMAIEKQGLPALAIVGSEFEGFEGLVRGNELITAMQQQGQFSYLRLTGTALPIDPKFRGLGVYKTPFDVKVLAAHIKEILATK